MVKISALLEEMEMEMEMKKKIKMVPQAYLSWVRAPPLSYTQRLSAFKMPVPENICRRLVS